MKNSFKKFKGGILDTDERNFALLLETLELLHNKVSERYGFKSPIFKGNEKDISQILKSTSIPLKGVPRIKVLENALSALDGMIRWQHPFVMHNINQSPLLDAVAIKSLVSLYNPNCMWDFISGNFIDFEKHIITQLANLLSWDTNSTDGVFTSGGKATLTYAVKIGINNCNRKSILEGVNEETVLLTSTSSHYSIEYVCNLLGIGKNGCVRIPSDNEERIDLKKLETTFTKLIKQHKKVACIILSGGNTLNNSIDPIEEVSSMVSALVDKYNLSYKPLIHVDSVIGWIWLFFNHYDFPKNPYKIPNNILDKINVSCQRISEIKYADSAAVDFHKNGFCPYSSSVFLIKGKEHLHSLNSPKLIENKYVQRGKYFLQNHLIEHSRSGDGILPAWVALQELGVDGFQKYIIQMMSINDYLRGKINTSEFEIINDYGRGFGIVLFPLHPKHHIKFEEMYSASKKTFAEIQKYCHELFAYVSFKSTLKQKPVIGIIANYRVTKTLQDIPALKLYPMSPFATKKELDKALSVFLSLKIKFDKLLEYSPNDTQKLTTVYPK